MSDEARKVYEFRRVMGLPVAAHPTMLSPERRLLLARLLDEECREVLRALGCYRVSWSTGPITVELNPEWEPNLAGAAHELTDVKYIAEGGLLEMGVDGGAVFDVVHDANMRKAPGGVPVLSPDGKVLKPEGWEPADVASEIERQRRDRG